MKILMLVNWKVKKVNKIPKDLQAPDYVIPSEKFWFFRYFPEDTVVDVIDISSIRCIEKLEKNKLHFYIIQAIRAITKIRKYDVVISHGMPSGIVLALFRRIFKTKAKHIVFDIGSFNSAAEKGKILKLNQFASKSIDGIIYHSSEQIKYYKKFYPWLIEKSKFLTFGTDLEYFKEDEIKDIKQENFILSIGYSMRDYETLIKAFEKIKYDVKLKIIGKEDLEVNDKRIELIGKIPKRDLNLQIQKAKFCILPLEYKNFSFGQMTLLQQMYYGKAVITAKVPSMVDYVKENENAILYEAKNAQDLAKKIKRLLKDEKLVEKIGKEARKSVEEQYNEPKMAKEILNFIKEKVNQ